MIAASFWSRFGPLPRPLQKHGDRCSINECRAPATRCLQRRDIGGFIEMRTEMPETSIWNDYWHFDRLSSFDDVGQTNYREDIAAGWKSFFDSLPDGASILDLCTGNGAIAVMAAEAGRHGGKNFRI